MGFSSDTGSEKSGRGLLLVFLSGENRNSIVENTELFAPPPSSSPIRSTNSSPILSKAQSTISICFLLVCVTFLLFTLSTFEPTTSPSAKSQINPSRRMMTAKFQATQDQKANYSSWLQSNWRGGSNWTEPYEVALQGMGTLYRRGTGAMNDLIVGHLVEDVTGGELRLFLRLLHRSGLTARSDLVLVFDSLASATKFAPVIEEENNSFLQLVDRYRELNRTTSPAASFEVTRFVKSGKSEKVPAEPLWGKKRRSNFTESAQLSYGSVVSFDATELDPENSLYGFLGHVPISLRRWACYPMLLGRVKRNFKHTILVDIKNFLFLGDPLGRVRNFRSESVHLSPTRTDTRSGSGKHRKNSDKTRSLNSGLIIGGSRGVRRLANTLVTEIARVAMAQHKKKNPVTDSGVLSQLGSNEVLLKSKSVNLVATTEPVPEASQLSSGSNSGLTVIHCGNGNGNSNGNHRELRQLIMKQICSFEVDSSVYRDC